MPEPVVRRRFDRSTQNFLLYYRPLAKVWTLIDNSGEVPKVIALERDEMIRIIDRSTYTAPPQMSKPSKDVLRLPIEKPAEIAFKVAVAKAIDEHTRLGLPVYVCATAGSRNCLRTKRVLGDDESRKSYPLPGFVLSPTTLQQAELVLLRAR